MFTILNQVAPGRRISCLLRSELLSLAALGALLLGTPALAEELFVAPGGHDGNPGTMAAPFRTLPRARDAVRALNAAGPAAGGVTVWLREGTYDLAGTLSFDGRDSGTAAQSVVYAAWAGEKARITGARTLNAAAFTKVAAGSAVWSRLDAAARGNVFAVNLRDQGISDYGTLKPRGFQLPASSPLELFVADEPMRLARWPNRGQPMARVASVVSGSAFTYSGTRPERWTQARDLWLEGFWGTTYADFHLPVATINTATKAVQLAYGPAQFGIEANRTFFAYNLLEEIDEPGEYYLDRASGLLYVWPTVALGGASIQVSMVEGPLLQFNNAQHLVLRDLVIEASRGALVSIDSGQHVRIERCILRNAGQHAASVGGSNNGLDRCDVLEAGESGVLLQGGIRASLTAGNNFVSHSRVERTGRIALSYHPAVNLNGGCGNIVSHNLISDLPHAAIIFTGNNHLIESNEIQRVCALTSDMGAIYAGRDWSYRGNVIRHNFIHHLQTMQEGNGVHGIYLDDGLSGVSVYGNILYQIADAGVFCGGGRDNIIRNNIIAACGMGHYNGDYARAHFNNVPGSWWNLLWRLGLDGIQYQQPPWSTAYPALAAVPNNWAVLSTGLWLTPQNTFFDRNAGWGNGFWMYETNFAGAGVFSVYASTANNQPGHAPLFDERASLDRSLRATSLSAAVGGFEPIPFQAIGPATGSAVPVTAAPVPAVLSAPAVTHDTVTLRWVDAGGLAAQRKSSHELQAMNGSSGGWAPVATYGADTETAHVTGLAASGVYSFRIRTANSVGFAYSNVLDVATLLAPLSPGTATLIEAENAFAVVSDVGGNGATIPSDATLDSGRSLQLFDVGDTVRVFFSVPVAGTYRLGARLRSGDAFVPPRTSYWPMGYRFKVDGAETDFKGDTSTLSDLDHSYGPTYWGTMYSGPLTLSAGSHYLEVQSAMPWAVLDYIETAPLSGGTSGGGGAGSNPGTGSNPGGGNAGTTQRIEAESPLVIASDIGANGAIGVGDALLDSGTSVALFDRGDAIRIVFDAPSAGNYRLAVRVRSGDASSPTAFWPNGYTFRLDGAVLSLQPDPATVSAVEPSFGPTYWGTMTAEVSGLVAGRHTLEIKAARDWAVADYLDVTLLGGSGPSNPNPVPGGGTGSESGSGGNTEVVRVEAETNLNVLSDVGGFGRVGPVDGQLDSGRSVALFDRGDSIRVAFTISTAGTYDLSVRVRSGDGSSSSAFWPNGYDVRLDGIALPLQTDSASVSARETSFGPTYWGTMIASSLTLTAGTHTVDIAANRDWALADYIEVRGAGLGSGGGGLLPETPTTPTTPITPTTPAPPTVPTTPTTPTPPNSPYKEGNRPPVALGGANHYVYVNTTVEFDASGSVDPDQSPSPLTFAWTQIKGPAAVALTAALTSRASFVPAVAGDYVFQVKVSDGQDSSTAEVRVYVFGR